MSVTSTFIDIARSERLENAYSAIFVDGALVESDLPDNISVSNNDGLSGYYIELGDSVVLDKPLHLMILNSDNSHIEMQNVVRLAKHAQLKLIEHYCQPLKQQCKTHSSTHISADENSAVAFYKLQQEGFHATHQATTLVQLQKNARFDSFQLTLGGQVSSDALTVDMQGEGAHAEMLGLYFPINKQVMSHAVTVNHHVPHCFSEQTYKGVLDDHAKATFDTMAVVAKGAVKSEAVQNNHNLLLSKYADVKSNPQLEIYNDDVSCSHGATIGQLDDAQRFYLQSRGISQDDADYLLVRAFYQQMLERINSSAIRDYFSMSLVRKLSGGC